MMDWFKKNLKRELGLKFITLILSFHFITACTHGHCQKSNQKQSAQTSRIWVYKYDQSKQCDKRPGTSIEVMLADFKDMKVTVFESKKQYDGLMRIQACGAFTGLANVFLINKQDLDKVTSRGYQQWDF